MTGVDLLNGFREAGLRFRSGDDSLRMGGVKIVLGEATGRLHPTQPNLNEYVLEANRAGYQIAIHAVQPSTVEAAVSALEYAHGRLPRPDLRHRIEHCAESPPHLFERIVKLRPVISMQPPFLYYSGERYLALIPPEQVRWLYRFKSFIDSGLTVAASSDTPVVPNNPLMGIYAAVARTAATGQVIGPEERITARQALGLYTANAAYASFDEGVKGTISAGKLADLVLLSDDPTRAEPEKLREIKVVKTVIGGEVVWES
jgi:predicted amidohydrolase YtcJ